MDRGAQPATWCRVAGYPVQEGTRFDRGGAGLIDIDRLILGRLSHPRIPHYGNPGKLTGIRLTIELAMSEPGENQVVAKTV